MPEAGVRSARLIQFNDVLLHYIATVGGWVHNLIFGASQIPKSPFQKPSFGAI
jgi:hypothetical protein